MEKSFETEVLTRLAVIESKIDDYKTTKEKAEAAYTIASNNAEELKSIKNKNEWLFRTTIGTILTSIIGTGVSIFLK